MSKTDGHQNNSQKYQTNHISSPTFNLTKLPPELQIMVWKASVEPRSVHFVYDWQIRHFGVLYRTFTLIKKPYTQPAILSVSKAARKEALKVYERMYGNCDHLSLPDYLKDSDPADNWTYFNFDIDTLELHMLSFVGLRIHSRITDQSPHPTLREWMDKNNLSRVQRLAIRSFVWDQPHASPPLIKEAFQNTLRDSFQHLEELILVLTGRSWLLDSTIQENCRQEITAMFETEKSLCPACKIPEITFLQRDDPSLTSRGYPVC